MGNLNDLETVITGAVNGKEMPVFTLWGFLLMFSACAPKMLSQRPQRLSGALHFVFHWSLMSHTPHSVV